MSSGPDSGLNDASARPIIEALIRDIDTRLDAEGHMDGVIGESDAITLVTLAYVEWMSQYHSAFTTVQIVARCFERK